MLTADHGEEFHEHGGFWHGLTLYDEQIHVPLLMKWPKGAPGGPAVGARTHLAPDRRGADAARARRASSLPRRCRGSISRRRCAARAEKDRSVLAEEDHEGNVLRALRTPEWKLIEANRGNPRGLPPEELFQISADPGEKHNLIGEQGEPRPGAAHAGGGRAELARSRAASDGGEAAKLTDAQQEALKALGYAE